jgi:hypothetical protein
LALLIAFAATAVAKPPATVLEELQRSERRPVWTRADQLPVSLRSALAKTFEQKRLFVADARAPYQDSCSVIVVGSNYKPLPNRRLQFAFATDRYFVVYYEQGGYGHSADVLVFSRPAAGASKFIWGGAEAVMDPARTPAELVGRIQRGKLMDDLAYIW